VLLPISSIGSYVKENYYHHAHDQFCIIYRIIGSGYMKNHFTRSSIYVRTGVLVSP